MIGQNGPLEHFASGDLGVDDIRDELIKDVSDNLREQWMFDGHNLWVKQAITGLETAVQDSS